MPERGLDMTLEGRPVAVDSARCQIRTRGNVTICNVGKGLPARPFIDPATSMDVNFDPREPRESIRFRCKRLRGVVSFSEVKVAGLTRTGKKSDRTRPPAYGRCPP
jgi:hypothetical protein